MFQGTYVIHRIPEKESGISPVNPVNWKGDDKTPSMFNVTLGLPGASTALDMDRLESPQADTAWWCRKVPKIEEGRSILENLIPMSYTSSRSYIPIPASNTLEESKIVHTNVIYLL